jgi:hypothetical protein
VIDVVTPIARVAVALGLIALVTAAPAGAAGWVTGAPLSPAGRVARTPMVALTPSGERFVAWEQLQLGSSTPEGIAVRIAPPSGEFGPAQLLPDTNEFDPSLTVGADGTAALAWIDVSAKAIHIARRAPGQASFVEATPLAVPAGEFPDTLHIVVTGGDVFASFDSRSDLDTSNIWAARARRSPPPRGSPPARDTRTSSGSSPTTACSPTTMSRMVGHR